MVDGFCGFPEAIAAVFAKTVVHLYVMHLVRQGLRYVPWKEHRAPASELRAVYLAPGETCAKQTLDAFEASPLGALPPYRSELAMELPHLAPEILHVPQVRCHGPRLLAGVALGLAHPAPQRLR